MIIKFFKQIIQGTGRVGIDLTATKYLKHGIALADTVSNYDTVVYLDKRRVHLMVWREKF